eukprot:15134423-Alexandrium_andersonii.AAC.1
MSGLQIVAHVASFRGVPPAPPDPVDWRLRHACQPGSSATMDPARNMMPNPQEEALQGGVGVFSTRAP